METQALWCNRLTGERFSSYKLKGLTTHCSRVPSYAYILTVVQWKKRKRLGGNTTTAWLNYYWTKIHILKYTEPPTTMNDSSASDLWYVCLDIWSWWLSHMSMISKHKLCSYLKASIFMSGTRRLALFLDRICGAVIFQVGTNPINTRGNI